MMFPIIYSQFVKELSMFDEPNTLYAFMQSIVNFNREPDDQIKIKDLSKYARTTIFDFEYPISDAFGKEEFEEMFLNHYMFRRINFDTLRSFQIHLQVKLNDIMPKYNKMMEGFSKIKFDGTIETHTRTQTTDSQGSNNTTSNSNNDSSSEVNYSDVPQGMLADVKNGEYMTEYTYTKGNAQGESTTNSSNTNNTIDNENIEIKKGDSIEEYKKYLEITSNIYSLIFSECDSLFYGLI